MTLAVVLSSGLGGRVLAFMFDAESRKIIPPKSPRLLPLSSKHEGLHCSIAGLRARIR